MSYASGDLDRAAAVHGRLAAEGGRLRPLWSSPLTRRWRERPRVFCGSDYVRLGSLSPPRNCRAAFHVLWSAILFSPASPTMVCSMARAREASIYPI
jgi:hypothetical protein